MAKNANQDSHFPYNHYHNNSSDNLHSSKMQGWASVTRMTNNAILPITVSDSSKGIIIHIPTLHAYNTNIFVKAGQNKQLKYGAL